MARRKSRKNSAAPIIIVFVIVVVLIVTALVLDYFGIINLKQFLGLDRPPVQSSETTKKQGGDITEIVSGDLIINFLELGNGYTGDCTFIKAGDVDILIDAGSRTNSVPAIKEAIDKYCTDGVLEYVIATHAHQDHIAGFGSTKSQPSIFALYECKTIIDFALTNATSEVYNKYVSERDAEVAAGAVHYTAAEVRQSGEYTFALTEGITMTILDNYYYYNKTSDENDYSVCCLITQGDRNFLFTGDLEKNGEKYLVEMNDLPHVEVFKGAHHGSYTASTDVLLSEITPERICVCCCAGSTEYTKEPANTFPAQAFINRVAKYTDKVYVTTVSLDGTVKNFSPMNGTITVYSLGDKDVYVNCSNNNDILKDTEWFKKNRECPPEWK